MISSYYRWGYSVYQVVGTDMRSHNIIICNIVVIHATPIITEEGITTKVFNPWKKYIGWSLASCVVFVNLICLFFFLAIVMCCLSFSLLLWDMIRIEVFNATFNTISVISWRSVLLVRKQVYPEKTTNLPQVTDKLYHIMLYRVHLAWAGFELTTLYMIGISVVLNATTIRSWLRRHLDFFSISKLFKIIIIKQGTDRVDLK